MKISFTNIGTSTTYKLLLCLLSLALVYSCTSKQSSISPDEFDAMAWKNDPNGCNNIRGTHYEKLLGVKQKLYGLDDQELRSILGKPDRVELYEKGQKFYIYFLNSGKQCVADSVKNGKSVHIRFNSTNQVNELSLKMP